MNSSSFFGPRPCWTPLTPALAACDRVEAESRDQARQAVLRAAAEDAAESGTDDDESHEHRHESRRKQWVEERLKQVGRDRALSWGWPNTYSYTKSLGEQVVLAARDSIAAQAITVLPVPGGAMRTPASSTRSSRNAADCVARSAVMQVK